MYIREFTKTNGKSKKKYKYLRLVENIRTENGPRQRIILNLGALNIHKSQYKALARRIEEILTGQKSFLGMNQEIEDIAKESAKTIFKKQSQEIKIDGESCYENVDINSIEAEYARTLGSEYVCHSVWKELGLKDFLIKQGITSHYISLIEALVIGRLVAPGSERKTKYWAEKLSAIYELTGSPRQVNFNSYYRAGDGLFKVKDEVERYLCRRGKDLFELKEHLFFFDLTNSYFEGVCAGNPKAAFGKSKEKRDDCRLVTLGLIVDELGFPKYSKLFAGNQSECKTLSQMIEELELNVSKEASRTVVIDAGIATEDNLGWLGEHSYSYIAVNRGKAPFKKDFTNMSVVKQDAAKGIKIEVKRHEQEKEVYILCRSLLKEKKEQSIRSSIEKLYLEKLEYYKNGLFKKSRTKSYRRIVEIIGRLNEKYCKIAKHYIVDVVPEPDKKSSDKSLKAIDICWKHRDSYNEKRLGEGSYILRTNRTDLTDKEIWDIYIMLHRIEKAFLSMKSHLGLRPNFHQKEHRVFTHMFISVLAYHILNIIEYRLRCNGDNRSWSTIRDVLSSHNRVTISYRAKNNDNKLYQRRIRITSAPEMEHIKIYKSLNLNLTPLPRFRM